MSDFANNIIATVEVKNVIALDEMAGKLAGVMGGISFEEETTGRYEEVPAFIAHDAGSGLTLILFGIPEGETCDAYFLECMAETNLSICEFRKGVSGLLSKIFVEKEVNSRGWLDYSNELANVLANNGIELAEPDAAG